MPSSKKTPRKARPRATGNRSYKPQLDHDGNGVNGGSLPKAEAAKAPPASPPAPAEEKVENPAAPAIVQMGAVQGRLMMLPTGDVQSLLSDELKVRLDVVREHPSTLELQERVRATEGRCAPIYFTIEPHRPPKFFAGIEQLAAALGAGVAEVPVIVIPSEDAGALQSYLAQKANSKPAETEEDDLYMRVLAHYSD
jgi:hypothetical protein